tara:strand:- start:1481 stop:1675 length:195 start_codon:yes stop_codon:yes gene_type:complete
MLSKTIWKQIIRNLHDSKLPTVTDLKKIKKTKLIGVDSPRKYDYYKSESKLNDSKSIKNIKKIK